MRLMQGLAAALMLWGAAPGAAHEGGVDARGVVVAADGDHIAIRGTDGRDQHFAVTGQTRVMVGGAGAKVSDVRPGMRAVVHARKNGDRLEASSIRASAPETTRPTKAK